MKKIRTALREDFGQLDRDLVRSELLSQEGVLTVSLEPSRNGLTIEYDPARINDTKLIDIMGVYGVYPEPVSGSVDSDAFIARLQDHSLSRAR